MKTFSCYLVNCEFFAEIFCPQKKNIKPPGISTYKTSLVLIDALFYEVKNQTFKFMVEAPGAPEDQ